MFSESRWQLVPGEVRRTAKLGCWPFHSSCFWNQIMKMFLWLYLLLCFRPSFKPLYFISDFIKARKWQVNTPLDKMKACFCNRLLRLSIQDEATSRLIQMRQKWWYFIRAPLASRKETPKLPYVCSSQTAWCSLERGQRLLQSEMQALLPSQYSLIPELEAVAHYLHLQFLS